MKDHHGLESFNSEDWFSSILLSVDRTTRSFSVDKKASRHLPSTGIFVLDELYCCSSIKKIDDIRCLNEFSMSMKKRRQHQEIQIHFLHLKYLSIQIRSIRKIKGWATISTIHHLSSFRFNDEISLDQFGTTYVSCFDYQCSYLLRALWSVHQFWPLQK